MKNLTTLAICLLMGMATLAQTSMGFNYQAVIRSAEGEPIANQAVGLRITLLDGQDATLYSETHSPTSSHQGVVSITVGQGQNTSGIFTDIPWSKGNIHLKVEVDPAGGNSYSLLGTRTIQAVPYALFALDGTQGEPGQDGAGIQSIIHNANGTLTITLTNGDFYTTSDITGPEGPHGPAGTGLNNRGTWTSGATYESGDYVFDDSSDDPSVNSMWIVQIEESFTSTLQPKDDLTNWVEFQAPQGEQGPEGPLVTGSAGQTLRHDGDGWVASEVIYNDGALVGIGTITPTEQLEVAGNIKAHGIFVKEVGDEEELLFAVRNSKGEIVLAVYETGVRVYVDDTNTKGRRSGFAVGGLSDQTKKDPVEYFRLTPDSIRFNIKMPAVGKGRRSGFAVGGLSDQTKEKTYSNLLFISPDSARIYVDASQTKGRRSGFAVGGLSDQTKGGSDNFLYLTPENYFIGHQAGGKNEKGLYNSFIGFEAGKENTSGKHNTFMGYQTGLSNTTGDGNLFLGAKSGFTNTAGNNNTFIGIESGINNSTGENNSFIGSYTGTSNTTGSNNAFIGFSSGFMNNANGNSFVGNFSGHYNISGNYNSFFGYQSGYKSQTGGFNVFLGYQTGYSNINGNKNVFIGYQTGYNNTSGQYNVFLGDQTGFTNQSGISNVFIGYNSGYFNTASNNVFIGFESGGMNTSGRDNAFIGTMAGVANTSGNFNVFMGNKAGLNNEVGSSNVFIGDLAGRDNTASNNIYIGREAGRNSTVGTQNVFLGLEAGLLNSWGSSNVFIGNAAGYTNQGGNYNVLIGDKAGESNTASNNVFIGNRAGQTNNTGNTNVFLGFYAGQKNTSGSRNVFIGNISGSSNQGGYDNVFIGNEAGLTNLSGSFNIYIGSKAGNKATTAHSNTIAGHKAGEEVTSGFYNTVIGYAAGLNVTEGSRNTYIGMAAGQNNATGAYNTYIGINAGLHSTGDKNVFIGMNAGWNSTKSNWLMIQNDPSVSALIQGDFSSGRVGVKREPTTNALEVNGNASKTTAGEWLANSDRRIKTDIKEITNALQTIMKLRPVKFKYSNEWLSTNETIEDREYYNFIAQEFMEVFPESVKGSAEYLQGQAEEILQIDSWNAKIVAIKAIQELIQENENHKERIETLENKVVRLTEALENLAKVLTTQN